MGCCHRGVAKFDKERVWGGLIACGIDLILPLVGALYVVRLVSDGLANNDIATRLFVSPRTVQSHLRHVCTKLGLSSRVQLVQEAARHT